MNKTSNTQSREKNIEIDCKCILNENNRSREVTWGNGQSAGGAVRPAPRDAHSAESGRFRLLLGLRRPIPLHLRNRLHLPRPLTGSNRQFIYVL